MVFRCHVLQNGSVNDNLTARIEARMAENLLNMLSILWSVIHAPLGSQHEKIQS